MGDHLALPATTLARLTPVAQQVVEQAARLGHGNGRPLASGEDLVVSLLIDGADEPEFAALLAEAGVSQRGLAREILFLQRTGLQLDTKAMAGLSLGYWSELEQFEPGAPLDCARILAVLLVSPYLGEPTRQLLIAEGLASDAALAAAWPTQGAGGPKPFGALERPPFGRLLLDERAHISFGREKLCSRLAAEYRAGSALLLHGPSGIGKYFLARQTALASGRTTVEVKGTDLVGLTTSERGLAMAELAAWLEVRTGGLLLAEADDPRLRGSLPIPAGLPMLVTSRHTRLAVTITPRRPLSRRRIPPLDHEALLRTLSAWQGSPGKPRVHPADLPVAIELVNAFLPEIGSLPGAAIDLIHVADIRQRQDEISEPVGREALEDAVRYLTNLPKALISPVERQRLATLEPRLGQRIIGQRPAIAALAKAVIRHELDIAGSSRPVGSFVFIGPTGVGKTELARALAIEFFHSVNALSRFDMAEYQQDHEISKLIGAPPGYLGHDKEGQLIAAIKARPQGGVLLLDEIDKSHERVYDFLLGLLDYAVVTSAKGEKVSLLNWVVIMTSNIGAGAKHIIGFGQRDESLDARAAAARKAAVKRHFAGRPEFLNRIDGIIEFGSLSLDELDAVLDIRLDAYAGSYAKAGMNIALGPLLREKMVREAHTSGYGARELVTRRFNEEIEDRVADALLQHDYIKGMTLRVELDPATGLARLERIIPPSPGRRRLN